MSLRKEGPPDPLLVLRTFGRVAISDLVTIVVLSVLYSVASLSIVTIGPALLALMDTFHASVSYTGTGGDTPTTAAGRASHFVESIWTYVRTGLPYTVVVIVAGLALYVYSAVAFSGPPTMLVAGVAGMYAVVVALVLVIRGADIVVRLDEEDRPGFFGAMRRAWRSLTSNVAYAVIHVVTAIALTVGMVLLSVAFLVFLLPGLLVLLELLNYEELDGAGAKAIRFAYLDPQD